MLLVGQAVLERERRDSKRVQELGGLLALGVEDQFPESSARGDNHRAAVGLVLRREKDGDRRV